VTRAYSDKKGILEGPTRRSMYHENDSVSESGPLFTPGNHDRFQIFLI
jgi:hypothetical protein